MINRFFEPILYMLGDFDFDFEVMPRTDILETEKGYEIVMEVPGFKKEDITISLDKASRIIKVEGKAKREEAKKEENKYLVAERKTSREFVRKFRLPKGVGTDIKAKLEDGILTIFVPFSEDKEVLKIEIE